MDAPWLRVTGSANRSSLQLEIKHFATERDGDKMYFLHFAMSCTVSIGLIIGDQPKCLCENLKLLMKVLS